MVWINDPNNTRYWDLFQDEENRSTHNMLATIYMSSTNIILRIPGELYLSFHTRTDIGEIKTICIRRIESISVVSRLDSSDWVK